MKRKIVVSFTVIIILSVILVSIYFINKEDYEITHPHQGDIIESVYGLGKIKSKNKFDLMIGVVLKVKKIFKSEGDKVKIGDPLIEFDNLVIKSPLNGTVTYLKYYVGETALPQIPILRIENLSDLFIELSLDQQSVLRVMPDQKVKISFEYLRGDMFSGKVLNVFPRNDEFIASIVTDKLPKNVLPGMTGDLSIEIGKITNALLLPIAAVQNGFISIKKKNTWIKKKVRLGHSSSLFIEILDTDLTIKDEIRYLKKD
jgi:multidrug efflux pump subunit AcrA (membrane-fusion protein)